MTKVPGGGDGEDGNQAFLLQDGMMKWDHKSLSHVELSSRRGLFFSTAHKRGKLRCMYLGVPMHLAFPPVAPSLDRCPVSTEKVTGYHFLRLSRTFEVFLRMSSLELSSAQ